MLAAELELFNEAFEFSGFESDFIRDFFPVHMNAGIEGCRMLFYNFFLPAALTFAQRALAIAESFFLAAGLIFLLVFGAELFPLIFAQRALAAADIFAWADALIVNFFLGALGAVAFVDVPSI
jgi:hypothetical protein